MSCQFTTIGIVSQRQKKGVASTLKQLIDYLRQYHVQILIESDAIRFLAADYQNHRATHRQMTQQCDLIISVGGDGNLLGAARLAAPAKIPVLGIHRGHLGFLTDIDPNAIDPLIGDILNGKFYKETRFMLKNTLSHPNQETKHCIALNDIILSSHTSGHMLTSEIHVNGQFLCSQESDGVIIATPTGSTAYALSGGGPIIHPKMDALVIVPMMPHTLTQRPIVLSGEDVITLTLPKATRVNATLHCDGQHDMLIKPGMVAKIEKAQTPLQLIHPLGYDYFNNLRGKLSWGKHLKAHTTQ